MSLSSRDDKLADKASHSCGSRSRQTGLSHELKKIFDKYVYTEKSQLFLFFFFLSSQKPRSQASVEGSVIMVPNSFGTIAKENLLSCCHAECYVNIVTKCIGGTKFLFWGFFLDF